MRTLVWYGIQLWRRLFPPTKRYVRLSGMGWLNEGARALLVEEIRCQPHLMDEKQALLLTAFEGVRDEFWKRADELMRTPFLDEM